MVLSGPIVMKFGGTSVADAEAITRVVGIVRAARESSGRAAGRHRLGDERRDGWLLELTAVGRTPARRARLNGVAELSRRHFDAIERLLPAEAANDILVEIAAQLDDLRALLKATAILRAASPSAHDAIVCTGELINSRIVAAALEQPASLPRGSTRAGRSSPTTRTRRRRRPRRDPRGGQPRDHPPRRRRTRAGGRRIRRRNESGRDDDARPRRIGLLRGASSAPRSSPARSRSGPTWTACSPPIPRRRLAARRAVPVVRRGVGAGVLRRQGAPSQHDPAGGRQGHPGPDPEQPARRRRRARRSPPTRRRPIGRWPPSRASGTSRWSRSPRRGC